MMTKQQVVDLIAWDIAMQAPRYAGGHSEVMDAMFGDAAQVVATWTEDGYQGTLAYAYEFLDGTIAIVTDDFGSCSGCDSWEDATDEEARHMIRELAINARMFSGKAEAAAFCETVDEQAEQYTMRAAKNLAAALANSSNSSNS